MKFIFIPPITEETMTLFAFLLNIPRIFQYIATRHNSE